MCNDERRTNSKPVNSNGLGLLLDLFFIAASPELDTFTLGIVSNHATASFIAFRIVADDKGRSASCLEN